MTSVELRCRVRLAQAEADLQNALAQATESAYPPEDEPADADGEFDSSDSDVEQDLTDALALLDNWIFIGKAFNRVLKQHKIQLGTELDFELATAINGTREFVSLWDFPGKDE